MLRKRDNRAIRSIEVTFRGMLPRDALVYFVRRCALSRELRGDVLRALLEHVPQKGYRVAIELRSGERVLQGRATHAAALIAVTRSFESLSRPSFIPGVAAV